MHADWVLGKKLATETQREMARRIFVELTALGEGTEDSARRVSKASLISLPGEGAGEVLQVLTDERLVTIGDADDGETVSIAHEALIREWGTLRRWVDARRQDIRVQRDLQQAEEEWRNARRDPDQLWRGGRLEQAIHWKERNPSEVRAEVDQFIGASRSRSRRDRAFRWGSVLLVIGLLFVLALPTMQRGLHRAQLTLARGRVNPVDGLKYVQIPPGEFQMGCSSLSCDGDNTQHRVRITKGFRIGQTEVTQAAYAKVMHSNPSDFKGADLPVESVSWSDADKYCKAAGMRLPTEAEWEYAARAGNTNEVYPEVDEIAVFNKSGTAIVGSKDPNPWGLYDMLGNVWEWTNDWYDADYYKTSPPDDPQGPGSGTTKVVRGGSWNNDPVDVSRRVGGEPAVKSLSIGFRCAGQLR